MPKFQSLLALNNTNLMTQNQYRISAKNQTNFVDFGEIPKQDGSV